MKVKLIEWADSQACIGCKHGALVYEDEKIGSSTYICLKNLYPDYPDNEDFILCSKYEKGG